MPGHVYKAAKGWRAIVDVGSDPATGKRRQRRIGPFKSRREAELAAAKAVSEAGTGPAGDTRGVTLAEYLRNEWLPAHARSEGSRPRLWPVTAGSARPTSSPASARSSSASCRPRTWWPSSTASPKSRAGAANAALRARSPLPTASCRWRCRTPYERESSHETRLRAPAMTSRAARRRPRGWSGRSSSWLPSSTPR